MIWLATNHPNIYLGLFVAFVGMAVFGAIGFLSVQSGRK